MTLVRICLKRSIILNLALTQFSSDIPNGMRALPREDTRRRLWTFPPGLLLRNPLRTT
jgi:hypothetical protein